MHAHGESRHPPIDAQPAGGLRVMRTRSLLLSLLVVVGSGAVVRADDDDNRFRANLSGYNEVVFATTVVTVPNAVPPPDTITVLSTAALRGAISTKAQGKFRATIDEKMEAIDYDLSYEGLEAVVTQAHIHFGQRHTVGGIVVWLCQTAAAPAPAAVAGDTPTCPGPNGGSVSGTITPAKVLTVAGQGIDAGEFAELIRAIRAGATYANVHSQTFPQGEIRGHIVERGDRDH